MDIILVDEVMDCRGIDSFKCLRVLVNSSTEKTLQLYYDEDPVKNKPKVPPSVWFNWVDNLSTLSFQILEFFSSSGFMEYDSHDCQAAKRK